VFPTPLRESQSEAEEQVNQVHLSLPESEITSVNSFTESTYFQIFDLDIIYLPQKIFF